MHEILPRGTASVPPALTSPTERGELSRRSPSDCEVQNFLPMSTGLVGNSRM